MAIDSLFERGTLSDWREFANAMRGSKELARDTVAVCAYHEDRASCALARTLVEHFHPDLARTLAADQPDDARS